MARSESPAYLRLQTIDAFLARHGALPVSRAALEGNWDVETGGTYSPTDNNPTTGTMGIGQWQGARKQKLIAWAAARGLNPDTLGTQLKFALSELRGDGILSRLNKQTNVTKAAKIVQADYEVSDPASLAQRQSDARTRYAAITGTGASSASSTGGVVALAESQIGKPYAWDTPLSVRTKNPKTFDCSGLSEWCYWHAGVRPGLPHNAAAQYLATKHRALSKAQPGDLVFLAAGRVGSIAHHVMIYAGDGQVIEAPDYGIPVRKRALGANEKGLVKKVGYLPGANSGGGAAAQLTAAGVTGDTGTPTTPTKGGSGKTSSSSGGGLSWSSLLPWNWGNAANTILQDVISFVIKLAFAMGGIVIVILGINRAAKGSST